MIGRGPPEIQPLGTLIKSQGTKIWVSKFFSQDPQMMSIYEIFQFINSKMKFV